MLNNKDKRQCFRDPIKEIFDASDLLSEAVDYHIKWNQRKANELFLKSNCWILYDFVNSIIWTNTQYVNLRNITNTPPILPLKDRYKPHMPGVNLQRQIHERDWYNCRFCWMPVIRVKTRKYLSSLYPNSIPFPRNDKLRHSAFFAMWAQYDHIVPHSRWWETTLDNLALTCSACNFWRNNYTLDEVWITDPRLREIKKTDWDWLERLN